jgi:hypothetical protein
MRMSPAGVAFEFIEAGITTISIGGEAGTITRSYNKTMPVDRVRQVWEKPPTDLLAGWID